jgi:hypothetical protein
LNITVVPNQVTKFYVAGSSPSSAINDAEITATCDGQIVYTKKITVLWTEIKINTEGTISSEHETYENLILDAHQGKLGAISYQFLKNGTPAVKMGFGFEVAGTVSPDNFNNTIQFKRDCEGIVRDVIDNTYYYSEEFSSNQPGEVPPKGTNDNSLPIHVDENPKKIFDYDVPGLNPYIITLQAEAYDVITTTNFYEFTTYNNNIRCSNILEFCVRVRLKSNLQNGIDNNASGAELLNEHLALPPK